MSLLLAAVGLLGATGLIAAFSGRFPHAPGRIALCGVFGAAVLGIPPCLGVLLGQAAPVTFSVEWSIPGGAAAFRLDALSAFFALMLLAVSLLCAVYGVEYMRPHWLRKPAGGAWCSYNMLVAGMVLVVLAGNALLFLMAWELMALGSFFLVSRENEREEVRKAAWMYLVATHLGTAALLAMFVLLETPTGSFDLEDFGQGLGPWATSAVFVLALAGFGTKAGFPLVHVWLPEAHPAAPSHVSAVMSGLMLKTGVYGLLRIISLLGAPSPWWGWALVCIGGIGGVGGVVFALAQHDLKRLLAYHSVENIGIITLGLGVGLIGWSTGLDLVCALGFAGALLHVLNHSLFKSLLFLGAGAVAHAAQTRDMDRLGGLLKRMPQTGATFLVGSMAICGLPPFNGFASEFLIFLGALSALCSGVPGTLPVGGVVLGSLALISALASACFTKAFGSVFLGEPRDRRGDEAHDPGGWMLGPMWMLAAACLALGFGAPWGMGILGRVVAGVRPDLGAAVQELMHGAGASLLGVTWVMGAFAGVMAALWGFRSVLLRGRNVSRSVTWDCGYAEPNARMQYTASSFAEPLTRLFHAVLRTQQEAASPAGLFPEPVAFSSRTPDVCTERVYSRIYFGLEWVALRARRLQHGNVHLYVLYIAAVLLVLLMWKLS